MDFDEAILQDEKAKDDYDEMVGETEETGRDDQDEDDTEEEEVVLGKGFNYKSESEEEDFDEAVLEDENAKDDYDEIIGDETEGEVVKEDGDNGNGESNGEKEKSEDGEARPDSFSKVDISRPKDELAKDFPKFPSSVECVIDLVAGQTLYLPASWFHCVSSFAGDAAAGSESGDASSSGKNTTKCPHPTHTAINYWYHPPTNWIALNILTRATFGSKSKAFKNKQKSSILKTGRK
jgi:hypothetical protein